MSKTKITLDEWEQAMADVIGDRADTVPKNFITMREYAAIIGDKHIRTATAAMQILLKAGRAESKIFKMFVNGGIRRVPHYRLTK